MNYDQERSQLIKLINYYWRHPQLSEEKRKETLLRLKEIEKLLKPDKD